MIEASIALLFLIVAVTIGRTIEIHEWTEALKARILAECEAMAAADRRELQRMYNAQTSAYRETLGMHSWLS